MTEMLCITSVLLATACVQDSAPPAGDPSEHYLSLSTIADVSGDHRADLLLGTPFAGPCNRPMAGLVRVISITNGSVVCEIPGPQAGALWGWQVGAAGDRNSDGIEDFFATAPGHLSVDRNAAGFLAVASGASGSELWRISSTDTGTGFGYAVESNLTEAGELDFYVTAPGPGAERHYAGRVFEIRFGADASGRTFTPSFGSRARWFGTAIAIAGADATKDAPQLAFGSWVDGIVEIRKMRTNGAARVEQGDTNWGWYGWEIKIVGSQAEHIAPEYAISARADDTVWLVGVDTRQYRSIRGPCPGTGFGSSVCAIQDANDDGITDLVVGAPGPFMRAPSEPSNRKMPPGSTAAPYQNGYVTAYSRLDMKVLWQRVHSRREYYATALCAVPDVDGDGHEDVAVAFVPPHGVGVDIISSTSGATIRSIRVPE